MQSDDEHPDHGNIAWVPDPWTDVPETRVLAELGPDWAGSMPHALPRRRTVLAVVVLVAVLGLALPTVGFAGVTTIRTEPGVDLNALPTTTEPLTTTTTRPSTVPPSPPLDAAGYERIVGLPVGARFVRLKATPGVIGALDVTAAANVGADPDEYARQLSTWVFRSGFRAVWQVHGSQAGRGSQAGIELKVLDFGSAAGAAAYATSITTGTLASTKLPATEVPSSEPTCRTLIRQQNFDRLWFCTAGSRVASLLVVGAAIVPPDDPALVRELVVRLTAP